MHQIRLHMSGGIGAPIVSEFYYQDPKTMVEDRKWCNRTFLHAYAVGFPDVSGANRRVGAGKEGKSGLVQDEEMDTEQEWHCCICPLTPELREALKDLTPKNEKAKDLLEVMGETGLMKKEHQAVHCTGTSARKDSIDDAFFPWSSVVNPIEVGDLSKPREGGPPPKGKGKGKRRDKDGDRANPIELRPKKRPLRRDGLSPRRVVRDTPLRKRRILRRSRSPGGLVPARSRSGSLAGLPRRRVLRSRSAGRAPGRRLLPRRRVDPYYDMPSLSPVRRSLSGPMRPKRRRLLEPSDDDGMDAGIERRPRRRGRPNGGAANGAAGGLNGAGSEGSVDADA